MMIRMIRRLRFPLLLLLLSTVLTADACLTQPSVTGACCSPAQLPAQQTACCQSAPAAISSPCCSAGSRPPVYSPPQVSGGGWVPPSSAGGGWVAPSSGQDCSGAGCSGSSSNTGCSGAGCATSGNSNGGCTGGDCSNTANVDYGHASTGGCTGSGCSNGANNGGGGDVYDSSSSGNAGENSASADCAEGSTEPGCSSENTETYDNNGENTEYESSKEEYSDGSAEYSNEEISAQHVTIHPETETNAPDHAETPESHIDIPEEKVTQPPEAHTDITEEYINEPEEKVKRPEAHIDIPEEKAHPPPEAHIDIPNETKPPKPKTTFIRRPIKQSTEEPTAYTDSPVIKTTRKEKSRAIEQPPTDAPEQEVGGLGSAEDEAACQFLTCDFEDNTLCLYETSPEEKPTRIRVASHFSFRNRFRRAARFMSKKWETAKDRYHNRVTGIPKAAKGERYAATYLKPKERSILTTDVLYFKKTTMVFQAYEATKGIELRMCCDTLDTCPWSSTIEITVAEKKWIEHSAKCPKGTKKIMFVCENTGRYQGACGLDNVRVKGQTCEETDPKDFFVVANK